MLRKFIRVNLLTVYCAFATIASAKVGEKEAELVRRYGKLESRQPAQKSAQGRTYKYGEYILFRSDDWTMNTLLINGRCEEVTYRKSGDWTEEHFKYLLEINGGRSEWEEQRTTNSSSRREWKRKDKTTPIWSGGALEIKTPLVEQTRDAIAKAAKEEASKLPKF